MADAVRVASAASADINLALQRREEMAAMLALSRPPSQASTLVKEGLAGEVVSPAAATMTQSATSPAGAAPGQTEETSLNNGARAILYSSYRSTGVSVKGTEDDGNEECDFSLLRDDAQIVILDRRKNGVSTSPSSTAKRLMPSTSQQSFGWGLPKLGEPRQGNDSNQPKVGFIKGVSAERELFAPDSPNRFKGEFEVEGETLNVSNEIAVRTAAV